MKKSIEIRADFLKALMIEDRQEIRGIRSMIYNVVTLLSTASFAITSYILGQSPKGQHATLLSLLTDGLIALLLWVLFLKLRMDLYSARQCLVLRQDLIKGLGSAHETEDFDPFQDARKLTPDVVDSELWWLPILATAAIATKSLVVWLQFP
jgi:hypothetical protein